MLRTVASAIMALTLATTSTFACTLIVLTAENGDTVYARTQEWGAFHLNSKVMFIPPGMEMSSTMPDGEAGITWTTQYGVVGVDMVNLPTVADGLNTEGLATGLLYLPDFGSYRPFDPATRDSALAPADIVTYLLTQFATVAEVRAGLEDIDVVDVAVDAIGVAPPFHLMVTDPSGEMMVVEFIDGETIIYDTPLGVTTNAPPYDWHLTNLRNYITLSPVSVAPVELSDRTLAPLGVGGGMFGLPGDFSPPSRFVRAAAFTETARETVDGPDAVMEAFRILDSFNLPLPVLGEGEPGDLTGMVAATQWTTASDVVNRTFYYHTAHNRRIRQIDLNTIDFESMDGFAYLPLDSTGGQDVEVLSLP